MNEDIIGYLHAALPYLNKPEFRQAIIKYGNASTQLMMGIANIGEWQDILTDFFSHHNNGVTVMVTVKSAILERVIIDCFHDNHYLWENNNYVEGSLTDIVVRLLDVGLDPNMKIGDQTLFLLALQMRKYTVVNKLLTIPSLVVTEDQLLAVSLALAPLLDIQASLGNRLNAKSSDNLDH